MNYGNLKAIPPILAIDAARERPGSRTLRKARGRQVLRFGIAAGQQRSLPGSHDRRRGPASVASGDCTRVAPERPRDVGDRDCAPKRGGADAAPVIPERRGGGRLHPYRHGYCRTQPGRLSGSRPRPSATAAHHRRRAHGAPAAPPTEIALLFSPAANGPISCQRGTTCTRDDQRPTTDATHAQTTFRPSRFPAPRRFQSPGARQNRSRARDG